MKAATREQLNALNRDFYDSHAQAFSRTRGRPWPGVERVLRQVPTNNPRVLDIGCGNGRLIAALQQQFGPSFEYTGIDASEPLLQIAREQHAIARATWLYGDFVAADPEFVLPVSKYELVALFGVLHHIPGETKRRELLEASLRRVVSGGVLAFTLWRFDADPRFTRRRFPPELYHELAPQHVIEAAELEPGDELVRWGVEGDALRYCHFVGDGELTRLLAERGLEPVDRFVSDGGSRRLNEYFVLRG